MLIAIIVTSSSWPSHTYVRMYTHTHTNTNTHIVTVTKLHHILGDFGCLVLERTGSDTHSFLLENDILYQHRVGAFHPRAKIMRLILSAPSLSVRSPSNIHRILVEKRVRHQATHSQRH